VMIELGGFRDDAELSEWVAAAVDFVRTLPPK
jgi:hypothetical protein